MIVIDSREDLQHPKVREFLEDAGIEVFVETLPAGDFRVCGSEYDVLVERKGGNDLTRSLSDGRLVDQLLRLTSVEGAQPKLLVEGSLARLKKYSRWPDSSVIGWLVGVMEGWKVQVIFLPSLYWTKLYLKSLHTKLEGKKVKTLYPLRFTPRAKTYSDAARSMVEGIPRIGPATADAILKHYHTLHGFLMTTEEELADIKVGKKRLGPSKANLIWEVLHHDYGRKREL